MTERKRRGKKRNRKKRREKRKERKRENIALQKEHYGKKRTETSATKYLKLHGE